MPRLRISMLFAPVLVSSTIWISVLSVRTAGAEPRHHIAIQLGYTKLISSGLKDDSLGVDFSDAFSGTLQYRYSLTPRFDLTFDSRATVSTSTVTDPSSGLSADLTLSNNYVGPGARWYLSTAAPRPFVQANVYLVVEDVQTDVMGVTVSTSSSAAGFGVSGGIDIPISRLISIPVEAHYLYGKPADDVSGVGIQAGIAWNFGAER